MGQNKIKIPGTVPYRYSQLVFNKGAKVFQQRKGSIFNKWYWNNRPFTCSKKMNLDADLYLPQKLTQVNHGPKCKIQTIKL